MDCPNQEHVDDLVMQMSEKRALELVYRAEDHAAELQRLADCPGQVRHIWQEPHRVVIHRSERIISLAVSFTVSSHILLCV